MSGVVTISFAYSECLNEEARTLFDKVGYSEYREDSKPSRLNRVYLEDETPIRISFNCWTAQGGPMTVLKCDKFELTEDQRFFLDWTVYSGIWKHDHSFSKELDKEAIDQIKYECPRVFSSLGTSIKCASK